MSPVSTQKTMRKDAARNRQRILEAAESVFARRGLDVSVEDVANAAGVGVASIYRAFGSKAGLVEMLFADVVERAAAALDECADAPTGWDALCRALRRMADMQLRERGSYQVLFDPSATAITLLRTEIEPRLRAIVDRAKSEGSLRSDFTSMDIAVLVHAATAVAARMESGGPEVASRHLELLIKGITASPDATPVPAPMPIDDLEVWLRAAVH